MGIGIVLAGSGGATGGNRRNRLAGGYEKWSLQRLGVGGGRTKKKQRRRETTRAVKIMMMRQEATRRRN